MSRDDPGRDDPADRRPRAIAGVSPAGPPRRLGASCAARDDRGRRRPGRLLAARRRGRRTRRTSRRRAGEHRPRPVRAASDHIGQGGARRRDDFRQVPRAGDGGRHQPGLRRPGRRVGHAQSQRQREPVPQSAGRGVEPLLLPAPRREHRRGAGSRAAGRAAAERSEPSRSSSSPAATSRRSSSDAGCILRARSISSRTRPRASTSARRPRFIGFSTSRCRRARRSSSSPPTSRKWPRSAIARWSSTAAGSSPSSALPIFRSRTCSPRPRPAWDGWAPSRIAAKRAATAMPVH